VSAPFDEDGILVDRFIETGLVDHFDALVERHQRTVFRVAVAVLGPGWERHAEDVAQDVFLQVFRQIQGFERRSRFSTWLYRIAYNRALDYRRSLGARPETVLAAEPAIVPPGADVLRSQALSACLQRLPDAQRTAIHLHYWLGHTVTEIAGTLAVQPGTVKAWLFRARHLLTRCLAGRGIRS
jgi:RNA polymerase sigma-70 factor (ECF subfamily)